LELLSIIGMKLVISIVIIVLNIVFKGFTYNLKYGGFISLFYILPNILVGNLQVFTIHFIFPNSVRKEQIVLSILKNL